MSWNRFGTPHTITAADGVIASGLSGDPVVAARQWISDSRALLGIAAAEARDLELLSASPIGAGSAVLMRQTFDGLAAGRDGLISIGVVGGKVAYVSSSLAPDTDVSGSRELGAADAVREAGENAGMSVGALSDTRLRNGWRVLDAGGLTQPAQARPVGVPTPRDGVRPVWETTLVDDGSQPRGVQSFVDAETGEVLVREELVDYLADNPTWTVFPNAPRLDYTAADTRVRWCWLTTTSCALVVGNTASLPWDVDARTGLPTFTTQGNNAFAVHNWDSNDPFTVGMERATFKPDREYSYPWTNQWREQRCNPAVFTTPARNDIDAARANLFAMHNRMHDWAYHLGFTEATWNLQSFNFGRGGAENDLEQGNAQAGGISGGPPNFAARDNANQITGPDGMAPITNMYLWQPIAGAFYAPCVDGDFDMSVIGHEYTHAISNRMAGGPNNNLSGNQAGAMGESWSDLAATEYLQESGFAPIADENPFSVGPYVTGDKQAGIRNYGMNASPLNYSDVGYDFLWNAFAKRGFGQAASTTGTQDFDPVPAFDSPFLNEATVRFRPTGNAAGEAAQLFVGRYEARATPIADTVAGTPLGDTFKLVPGTYELVARANGYGHVRTTLTVSAGQLRDLRVNMPLNLASSANGASASGDGTNLGALIDDTEATNWASLGSPSTGKQVTVRLDPSRRTQTFDRVQVSAMLRTRQANDPGGDTGSQNRFTALRQFELLACDARGAVDCTQAAQFTPVFTSPVDAFPSVGPRPRAPDLIVRSFSVPSTRATHLRLRVLTNQCTGGPAFQGDQDDDPRNTTDCAAGSTADDTVRAAELQVFR